MSRETGARLQWWQSAVIYQVYPRSFQDSNGDGIGDLRGITARLDYLSWLGVDAIWLSPVFRSPMADFGYDVSDYEAIDPIFGDLAELDALVEAAHARRLRVILDFVPNHTSSEHAWFKESRRSRGSPKRTWYIWRDALPDGSPPNAWQSAFGGSAWEWDQRTGQYYFHSFLKEQPDLDWTNPEVRAQMADVLRFWFRRGVDGFRIDVVNLIAKRRELLRTQAGTRQTWGDEARIQPLIAGLRRVADEFPDRLLIGEIWLPLKKLVAYYGREQDGLQLPFNFQLLTLPWSAARIGAGIGRYESLLPDGAWPNWVLGNHDRSRIASRVGPSQARVAAMLLLTLRGTPTIYYGDELGMTDQPIPADLQQDPARFGPEGGRDPERTPMRWDDSPHVGFTAGTPWLPVGDGIERANVRTERDDPSSMLELHRQLIALRKSEPALTIGKWRRIPTSASVLAYERSIADRRVVVVLNFGNRERSVDLSGAGSLRIRLSTHLDRSDEGFASSVRLRSNEGVVLQGVLARSL